MGFFCKMNCKYVSKNTEKDGIIHCPHCRGVVLRNYKKDHVINEISFRARCPHCGKDVFIKLKDGAVIQKTE